MYVPDVTDVNGGRMKGERFPCLTEDLISLFWVFGREAERGAGEILKCRDVGGNDDHYSFDLYLSRFAKHACSFSQTASMHKQCSRTHSHLGYKSAP